MNLRHSKAIKLSCFVNLKKIKRPVLVIDTDNRLGLIIGRKAVKFF